MWNEQPLCKHQYERASTWGPRTFAYYTGLDVPSKFEVLFAVSSVFSPGMGLNIAVSEGYKTNHTYIILKGSDGLYVYQSRMMGGSVELKKTSIEELDAMLKTKSTDNAIYWWKPRFKEFLDELKESQPATA